MALKTRHNQKKIIILVSTIIIIIIATCVSIFVLLRSEFYDNITILENETIKKYNEQYVTLIHGYRQLARSYFERIESDNRISKIMWQANHANEEEKNILRDELMQLSFANYDSALSNGFRYYHFALVDGTSFLRMHTPDKFGDDLYKVRDSIRIANEDGRYVEGFEQGITSNSYRFVFPLFYKGKGVGCVEISLSISSITKLMGDFFNTRCSLIIRRSIIEDKIDEEYLKILYEPTSFSSEYYVDTETRIQVENYCESNILKLIDDGNLNEGGKSKLNGDTFFISLSYKENYYSVVFLRIENVLGDHAGYLIFINDCTHFYSNENLFNIQSIILSFMLIMVGSIVLILVKNRFKMEKMTYYDQLTGAYNRNKLYKLIEHEVQRNIRYNIVFSIILFDVDNFKEVNDTYGHVFGDKVLKRISRVILANIRINDILFRYGGDEFLLLLPNTDQDEANLVADKIKSLIKNIRFDNIDESVKLSTGVVQYNTNESVEQLIHRSDKMLYKDKQKNKSNPVS